MRLQVSSLEPEVTMVEPPWKVRARGAAGARAKARELDIER